MDTRQLLQTFAISLGLGLLVGLQRERKGEELAGIRTFALLTLFGTVAGFLAKDFGVWILAAGALAVGGLMAMGAYLKARVNQREIGLTTEVAALLMYGLGAYLTTGLENQILGVVVGATAALLLHWKAPLHGFVRKLGDRDIAAMMQFVLIALVILPILPRESYGPYQYKVLNPFGIWLVVVLVVGISLAGYVLYKLVPPTTSALLGGAIGGLVSSTATTVSYARRSRGNAEFTPTAAQAIMLANTVSVLRVLALLAIFAADSFPAMVWPLACMAAVMGVLGAATFWFGRGHHAELPEYGNPAELKSALYFGAIYALVKLGTAWAMDQFGHRGLFIVGGISGLTDVDAITLSMGQLATGGGNGGQTASWIAWRVILVAILSNLLFKAGCVYILGNTQLKRWITLLFGAAMAGGLAIIFLWPDRGTLVAPLKEKAQGNAPQALYPR